MVVQMLRIRPWWFLSVVAGGLTAFLPVTAMPPMPAVSELNYIVKVDGKPAGRNRLVISSQGGKDDVRSECTVDVRVLVFKYHYDYKGHEQWQNNRLVLLDSVSHDGGKTSVIKAGRGGDGLAVDTNGKVQNVPADISLSSYWRRPATSDFTGKFLEVDTGRIFTARLLTIGRESVSLNGDPLPCTHVRVSGGDDCDLWYDNHGRMVRQSSTDDGHTTVVEMHARAAQ